MYVFVYVCVTIDQHLDCRQKNIIEKKEQFKTYEQIIFKKGNLTGNRNICFTASLLRKMQLKTLSCHSKRIRLAPIKSCMNIKCVGKAKRNLKLESNLAISEIADDAQSL